MRGVGMVLRIRNAALERKAEHTPALSDLNVQCYVSHTRMNARSMESNNPCAHIGMNITRRHYMTADQGSPKRREIPLLFSL